MSKDSHPADILASADFAQQLKAAQASNDYVILDSPALGESSPLPKPRSYLTSCSLSTPRNNFLSLCPFYLKNIVILLLCL